MGRHLVGKLNFAPVKVEALVELLQVILKKIEVVSPKSDLNHFFCSDINTKSMLKRHLFGCSWIFFSPHAHTMEV